ncbi:FAD/NAD(P)-binding domain-containing protein [Hypoxylon trugodes]|uniref:FAD/NAD(P)-binding domain-containing protein n=1 Tax=Hypoxylon trugodes TaxID=326681 RepID=UPI00219DADE7|nr:FAD/NAD(P)-binding domain-containing protein [Hypoxylon trugodes]KAI1385183.1 FAD/NAD(P)-binding domain-containing protein [Hypoxylon trugodes]
MADPSSTEKRDSITMEKYDCVVVGAGWYGLAAAKQFHCTQPECSLAVFDSQSSLGGTWADDRLYPGLKSNNLLGTFEYPDFPMDTPTFGVKTGEHMPGEVINNYLKAYAARFGITNMIRLNTKVLVAEHQDTVEGGWMLTVAPPGQPPIKVFARRAIFATGLTSEPFLPHFAGQETFGGRIFHGKQFKQNSDTLETAKRVTIFGATKFAWDAVYAYATAGVKVDWVIRSSGHGPCWISPSYVTPLKKWIEKLANVRFLTWFSPCVWGDIDGYGGIRGFYHGTAFGRSIVNSFWKVLGGDVINLNAYDSHPKTAKLKPWTDPMFTGASFSIMNYDTNFMDLVKGDDVNIYVSEIDHLSPGKVHLSDGTEFESDVLLAHTGWKHVPPIKFLPEGIEGELGIPHTPRDDAPSTDLANDAAIMERVDKEILERFPRLKDQPVWNKNYIPMTEQKGIVSNDDVTPYKPLTPYMLHHFIVPPSERFLRARDTAFIGIVSNFSNMITAHLQGLWISAYFSGKLERDPSTAVGDEVAMQQLRYETVLHNRFGKWRYPTDGTKNPNFIFDAVPYLDLLQRDLGLGIYRKKGFFAELYDPYGPEDYRDVNSEWTSKYGDMKKLESLGNSLKTLSSTEPKLN